MKATIMNVVACCALACATLIANLTCPLIFHQDPEPKAVRKLRKF